MSTKLNFLLPSILILTGSLFAQGVDPGTENLTHSWTFNDGTANDYVGSANGTLMGGAGIEEGSLFMYDINQWMEMPADSIAINTYNEVTIEAWFVSFAGSNTGYHMLAFFGDTLNSVGVNYYFFTPARGDDKSRAAISCGVLTSSPWTGESGADGPELDDGELHHMVSTINDSDITLYIDGELNASTPLDTNNSIAGISPRFAYLAKGGYDVDPTWQGEILEFNIYNRALTADEILFLSLKDPYAAVDENKITALPKEHRLLQNYPNPFNAGTLIVYDVKENCYVTIQIYNSLGQHISTLVDGQREAKKYTVSWIGRDDNGQCVSSGLYFYKITTSTGYSQVRKMIYLE
jgi:hypothetical protein